MKFSVLAAIFLAFSLGHVVAGSPAVYASSTDASKESSDSIATTNAVAFNYASIDDRDAEWVAAAAGAALRLFWGAVRLARAAGKNPTVQGIVGSAIYDAISSGYEKLTNLFSTPSGQSQNNEAFIIDGDATPSEILSSYINGVASYLPSDTQCIMVEKDQTTGYGGNFIWAPIHISPSVSGWRIEDYDQFCTNGGALAVLQYSSVTGSPPVIAYSGVDKWKILTDSDNYRLVISYNLNVDN